MRIGAYRFGSVTIDGVTYHNDIVIESGSVRKRRKAPSRKYREQFGHVPLSEKEEIPWDCRRLVIGTGAMGELPVADGVRKEAQRRHVKLVVAKTGDAVRTLKSDPDGTNAILHITC